MNDLLKAKLRMMTRPSFYIVFITTHIVIYSLLCFLTGKFFYPSYFIGAIYGLVVILLFGNLPKNYTVKTTDSYSEDEIKTPFKETLKRSDDLTVHNINDKDESDC